MGFILYTVDLGVEEITRRFALLSVRAGFHAACLVHFINPFF